MLPQNDTAATQKPSDLTFTKLLLDLWRVIRRMARGFFTTTISLIRDASVDRIRRIFKLQNLTGDGRAPMSEVKEGRGSVLPEHDRKVLMFTLLNIRLLN
jgi:hypothetical protein